MLTAVCMNPSFDRTVTVDELLPGRVNRIRDVRVDVGGKGINVATVIRRLGLKAQVIGLAGEDGYDKVIDALRLEGIDAQIYKVRGSVRMNTKVEALSGSGVTELNEPGTPVTDEELRYVFGYAKIASFKSRYVVLTGSLPPGCPPETYRDIMLFAPDTRYVLDVSGPALIAGLEAKPFLIKPNRHELAETLGVKLNSLGDVSKAARQMMALGAQNVLVSLGGDGAICFTPEGSYFTPALEDVPVRSTVGAGDAMVAGVLAGLEKTGNMVEALRYGAAAGQASVMTEGTQLIRVEDFEHLLSRVRIQEV